METTRLRIKDYIHERSDKAERRYYALPIKFLEVEENGAKKTDENQITGYAAMYNRDSEDFGGWIERIAPGAFKDVLNDDTWAYLNHSINHPLGRNKINLILKEDEQGLNYTVTLPDTTDGNNMRILTKAGIIYKSSFAFIAAEETFTKGDPQNGKPHIRTITKMERLFDVSPLSTDPAYPDTSVAARSLKKMEGIGEIQQALRDPLAMRLLINLTEQRLKTKNKWQRKKI
jgi:HK97 family phage prohead protease